MKKLIAIILSLLMLCSLLCACGEKPAEGDESQKTDTQETGTQELTMPTVNWGESEVVLPEDVFD